MKRAVELLNRETTSTRETVVVHSGSTHTRPYVLHQFLTRLDPKIGISIKLVARGVFAVAKTRVLGWLIVCGSWCVGSFSDGGGKVDDAICRLEKKWLIPFHEFLVVGQDCVGGGEIHCSIGGGRKLR